MVIPEEIVIVSAFAVPAASKVQPFEPPVVANTSETAVEEGKRAMAV
ncbi:MAG TPA: hypothetical protein VKG78_09995 [Opitutaceae bacterium]|nr:hypothetical protein [Opitutaceae bacterium]